jgi:hypothetical protein
MLCLSVDPELAGEARKTALEWTLLNHSLRHYCWKCVVTRQPLSSRSVAQQPRRCTSTFSSLDVKYCGVCLYPSLVLFHFVLGIPADIVVVDFGIYTKCYSVCAFHFTPHSHSLGELQKRMVPNQGRTVSCGSVDITFRRHGLHDMK